MTKFFPLGFEGISYNSVPFELTVEIPVQLHLELEVNLLVHNVIEREIEEEKVQMNPPPRLIYT